jgi:hypothetical protein
VKISQRKWRKKVELNKVKKITNSATCEKNIGPFNKPKSTETSGTLQLLTITVFSLRRDLSENSLRVPKISKKKSKIQKKLADGFQKYWRLNCAPPIATYF